MKGQLSHESEIDVPAGVVWETYGTLELSKQIAKLLPNLVQNIQVLEGDGGVGTVLAITLAPSKLIHLIMMVMISDSSIAYKTIYPLNFSAAC